MRINYDKEIDAMYIRLKEGKISHTIPLSEDFMIDVDKKGNTMAIELLNASVQLSKNGIDKLFKKISKNKTPFQAAKLLVA